MLQKLIMFVGLLFFIVLSGNAIEGTSVITNMKSAFLVLGGALTGAFLAFPLVTFRNLFKSLRALFKQDGNNNEQLVKELENLALLWRQRGIRALDEAGSKVGNIFLRKGIELVADGYDRFDIRNIMERDFELYFSQKESQINILNTLTKLAPVFGFVGTIIGLINVLSEMGDPDHIGKGMALALLTTFYGLLFANFLFLPLAKKLAEHVKAETTALNVILEGVMDIADLKNSKSISHRLSSYLDVAKISEINSEPETFVPREASSLLSPQFQELMSRVRK